MEVRQTLYKMFILYNKHLCSAMPERKTGSALCLPFKIQPERDTGAGKQSEHTQ